MIAYIKGKVISYNTEYAIIENNGIGFRIFMPDATKLILDEDVLIYTYLQIREDAHILFGFNTIGEHDLFLKLISVKGIGPKIAINALGSGGAARIVEAIEAGDVNYLKSLSGIGPKAASQIVLDLKGKLIEKDSGKISGDQNVLDAVEGLKALGYKSVEINNVIKQIEGQFTSADEYIRKALSLLIRKKGV